MRALALASVLLVPGVAAADPLTSPAVTPAAGSADAGSRLDASRRELDAIQRSMVTSDAERHRIAADVEQIRTDRVRLAAALIETTGKVKEAEAEVAAIEARLADLRGSQDAITHSLDARRDTIAEVLAALQRLGRRPPPALLVNPDDILATIRSSMLLGAVLPGMRDQVEALATDLVEMRRLGKEVGKQRDDMEAEVATLGHEQRRLDALVAARQAAQSEAEAALGTAQGRAADLGRQATSLKDLIARLEQDDEAAARAADAARAAADARSRAARDDADDVRARAAAGSSRDPARLAPAVEFASTRASLALPVAGRVIKRFGAADAFGGTEKGVSIATLPRAVVSTPSDGWVAFSGPYRSYGQLLIINAGSGYYVVLAGLKSVNVAPKQFVLAGEPVGSMGDGSVKTAAAIALGATEPVLYVEFRKDGAAVDSTPWWAKAELEKVRG